MARRCQAIRPESVTWGFVDAGTGNALLILNLDHNLKFPNYGYRQRSKKIT